MLQNAKSPFIDEQAAPGDRPDSHADYQRVAAAIAYLETHRADQPSLSELAAALNVSPGHLQRVFARWAGVSPKQFLAVLTHRAARQALTEGASVLDAALEAGLSGPSRLHDLCVTMEAMTPGQVKAGGAGLTLRYGWHASPFGPCLIAVTDGKVAGLAFAEPGQEAEETETLQARWPAARWIEDQPGTAAFAARIFPEPSGREPAQTSPLRLLVRGTAFQVKVWQALLEIPEGRTASYGEIARKICTAKASRAVGQAVGRNPIAWLIPCHRVLRSSGGLGSGLGGYAWGPERKRAMLAYEALRATE